jgi:REP element-mobilizing transposase RayT
MTYDTENHQRRSIRLKEYDYSQEGAYFVTICTHKKVCILSEITNGEMRLNKYGNVVIKCWLEVPHHFPNVEIDTFVVMPNHFHGILVIHDCRGEVTSPTPKGAETAPLRRYTLGQIMAYFKYQTTKSINQICHTPGTRLWQRNYYEHVIRNEHDLNDIRQYILDNPVKWDMDENNPGRQINELKLRGELICLTR